MYCQYISIVGGITNFSIDLISALPYLTMDEWTESLLQAKGCGAKHVSIYDLQIEENTAFGRWYTPGVYPLPAEDTGAKMYKKAVEILCSSSSSVVADDFFEHYEVSNYAKKGYRSRHNQKYWSCSPVYGFGMAAASYINGKRAVRPSSMRDYREYVNTLDGNEHEFSNDANTPLPTPDVYEYIMLALRTSDGVHLDHFRQLYGKDMYSLLLQSVKPYENQGMESS